MSDIKGNDLPEDRFVVIKDRLVKLDMCSKVFGFWRAGMCIKIMFCLLYRMCFFTIECVLSL
jgi:hypothetical protein